MRYVIRVVVCALTFSALSSVLAAQETRGSIEGIVRDTSGAVLPGVTVEARSPALVGASTAITDAQGIYRFPALAPGVYEVSASLAGFSPRKVDGIQLLLGQILKVDMSLAVAGVAESVQVLATSPVIDVRQNAASAVITAEVIDRIPKGRDFASVLVQAPGTSNETKAGGYQLDGSSGSENHFLVDGLDMTSLRTGTQNNFGNNTAGKHADQSDPHRLRRRGAGEIQRLQRRIPRGDGRRRQRADEDREQRLARQRRDLLRHAPPARCAATDAAAESVGSDDRGEREDQAADYTDWEPVFDLGGPMMRDRIWFYAGGVTEVDAQRAHRTVRPERRDRNVQVHRQAVRRQLQRDEADHEQAAHPRQRARPPRQERPRAAEPSSPTASPATARRRISPARFTRITSATRSRCRRTGWPPKGLRQRHRRDAEVRRARLRRRHRAPPFVHRLEYVDDDLSGYSGVAPAAERLRRQALEQHDGPRRLHAVQPERRCHLLCGVQGPASDQDRLPVRAARERRPDRTDPADDHAQLERLTEHVRRPAGARHLRLLEHDQERGHRRRHSRQQRRRLRAGRLDDQPAADAQPRDPRRERGRSVLPRRESRHSFRLERQDHATRRLRVGHRRRQPMEGVRQLGNLQRHHEARDAAGIVRRPALDYVLLHARHVRLAVDHVPGRASAGRRQLPGHLHRADRLASPVE